MLEWVNRHGVEVMLAYVVYNSAVQALPKPEGCSKFYTFFYGFCHTLAANWGLVSKAGNQLNRCDSAVSLADK
jgi:hypothetical protein